MNQAPENESGATRVAVVEKHTILREALALLLAQDRDIEVVGQFADPSAVWRLDNTRIDVVVYSYDFEEAGEIGCFASNSGRARWLILTGNSNPENHLRAVQLGATGIISKNGPADLLLKAIHKVRAGEAWFDRATVAAVLAEFSSPTEHYDASHSASGVSDLTKRERQVISLVAEGLKTKQIADRLFISETTVRHHLTSIYSKLEVSDRLELIIFALKAKLVRLAS
jgi:DNA-binding NarL/FixJ family response regulator